MVLCQQQLPKDYKMSSERRTLTPLALPVSLPQARHVPRWQLRQRLRQLLRQLSDLRFAARHPRWKCVSWRSSKR